MATWHKKRFLVPLAGRLIYLAIISYRKLLRFKMVNDTPWRKLHQQGETVLLCLWHQHLYGVSWFDAFRNMHPAVMISLSADGELFARAGQYGGWETVRGSSSKGGGKALKKMIRHLRKNRLGMHILDGPRGPMGVAKAGVIQIARLSGAHIVPFEVQADRAWTFNSWDRFFLPKPFSRVTVCFKDPLPPPHAKDPEAFETRPARTGSVDAALPALSG